MSDEIPREDAICINALVKELTASREEVACLAAALAKERAVSKTRRDLLLQARAYILEHQERNIKNTPHARVSRSIRRLTPKLEMPKWMKRSHHVRDGQRLSKAALERHILRAAQRYVAGIEAVVLDFSDRKAGGANWRLAGLTCGHADREDALAAVHQVVARNAYTTMIED